MSSMKRMQDAIAVAALAVVAGGCSIQDRSLAPHSDYSPGYDAGSSLATLGERTAAFRALDDDDDARITRFEAMEWPALTARFHEADRNDDEAIDFDEFERALARSDFGRL